jgi:sugar O-acyltransferase (sialic acid O-acetyltransferase NeuD family)
MKPQIILVGGGGHCMSCIDVVEQEGKFQIAGIVDAKKSGDQVLGYPVLGGDDDLPGLRKTYEYALVTIGQIKTPITRMKLYERLRLLGFNLPSIISPRAYVSKHAVIRDGSIIMHDALINAQAEIGNNCIINTKALIEHDSKIGSHCHISTGAIINGGVTIGHGTFVGSNAVVRESVQINENFFVRSGSLFSGAGDE